MIQGSCQLAMMAGNRFIAFFAENGFKAFLSVETANTGFGPVPAHTVPPHAQYVWEAALSGCNFYASRTVTGVILAK